MPLLLGANPRLSMPVGTRGQHDAHQGAVRRRIDIHPTVVIENGALHDRETEPHSTRLGRAKRRKYFFL